MPALAAYTLPGAVLDPVRLLVASTSNFGAPLANADQLAGSLLLIDPRGAVPLVIPVEFAAAGGQVSALDGKVQLYSSQSAAFRNAIHNPLANSARYTGVSNPLGLSINNAFGRIWPANAPFGLEGIGSSSIDDPTGEPLAGAPNLLLGGVYVGDLTPRLPLQVIAGALNTGAIGTALLGRSPDGSRKAVFAVVTADGSVVQESTLKALGGLAPTATVLRSATAGGRAGQLFADALNQPIDKAPVTIESSDPNWASNTTLDVLSDFYVANRGNNTIVRMRQDGSVVASRTVTLADGHRLGRARINGIAGSPDAKTLWVTVSGRLPGYNHSSGAVLELSSF